MSDRIAGFLSGLILLSSAVIVPSEGAELVHADGRRETVAEVRKGADGRWMEQREGRLVQLTPGDVVVIILAGGKEEVTIPALLESPDPPEAAALLASLRDPKNEAWLLETAPSLAKRPTRGIHDALVALTTDKSRETRARAIGTLTQLHTKESVTAATKAVLAEKDTTARRRGALLLFSVQEIFQRSDAAASVEAGIAHSDPTVRYVFAMLSPPDLEAANAILRNEALKSSDHHVRESAALELGQRGDAAGTSVLIGMLGRTSLPGFEARDPLGERLMIEEQVEVCAVLGKLGGDGAKAALGKAASSRFEPVKAAARKALETIAK
jgi:hypothetical protein